MSRQVFSVAYDGSARSGNHSIDVQTLAPALLAFGRLLREANTEFNGKKSVSKIFVVSDFEHKCFNINFELIVGMYKQVQVMLGMDGVKTAKEVLEWIGLLRGKAATETPYLQYLEWKKGRNVVEEKSDIDPSGSVKVTIIGDNNSVYVAPPVLALSKNNKALRATKDAFLPLGKDGFDVMRSSDGDTAQSEIGPQQVEDIVASCSSALEESKLEPDPEIETTPAWLSVYSPVFDVKADKWRFRLGREVIYADISETDIAQEAMNRGGSFSEDAYQVMLEITNQLDQQGKIKSTEYKIVEVVRFVPAPPGFKQGSFFDPNAG